jgi:hypothetical protein
MSILSQVSDHYSSNWIQSRVKHEKIVDDNIEDPHPQPIWRIFYRLSDSHHIESHPYLAIAQPQHSL